MWLDFETTQSVLGFALAGEPGAEDFRAHADAVGGGLLQLAQVGGATGDQKVKNRRLVDGCFHQAGIFSGDNKLGHGFTGRFQLGFHFRGDRLQGSLFHLLRRFFFSFSRSGRWLGLFLVDYSRGYGGGWLDRFRLRGVLLGFLGRNSQG